MVSELKDFEQITFKFNFYQLKSKISRSNSNFVQIITKNHNYPAGKILGYDFIAVVLPNFVFFPASFLFSAVRQPRKPSILAANVPWCSITR